MRKIIAIIILIIAIAILVLSMNQAFIYRIKQDRYFAHIDPPVKKSLYQKIFLRSDRWTYGDLYGISFIPQYKIRLSPFKKYPRNTAQPITNKVLYIIGDSFLADKTLPGAFPQFDNVIFLDRRFGFGPIKLDSTKQNYLIMEFAEFNLLKYDLYKTQEVTWTASDLTAKANYSNKPYVSKTPFVFDSGFARLGNIIFNKDLSRNIEQVVFDDKIFTPFKELKAALNYDLLGRLPKEVAVSTDKKRLLVNTTVDTSNYNSDFRPLSTQDIDTVKLNIDVARSYYKSIGFKKVYLSIIPNAVSVYDSHRGPYNHILERVEKTTDLPLISIYSTFKTDHRNLYSLSDAHWNPTGFNTWIAKANSVLDTAR